MGKVGRTEAPVGSPEATPTGEEATRQLQPWPCPQAGPRPVRTREPALERPLRAQRPTSPPPQLKVFEVLQSAAARARSAARALRRARSRAAALRRERAGRRRVPRSGHPARAKRSPRRDNPRQLPCSSGTSGGMLPRELPGVRGARGEARRAPRARAPAPA